MTVLLELKYGNLYVTIPYTVMHYYRETRVNAVIGAQVYLLSKQRSNDSFTGAEVWKRVCDNTSDTNSNSIIKSLTTEKNVCMS